MGSGGRPAQSHCGGDSRKIQFISPQDKALSRSDAASISQIHPPVPHLSENDSGGEGSWTYEGLEGEEQSSRQIDGQYDQSLYTGVRS